MWEKLLSISQVDFMVALVSAIIAAIMLAIAIKILSIPVNYIEVFSNKSTKKECTEFIEAIKNEDILIITILDKIARSIVVILWWLCGVLLLLSPVITTAIYNIRYTAVVVVSFIMFFIVFIALSKPINLCYAIRNQEKYKNRVKKKLGRLPDTSG